MTNVKPGDPIQPALNAGDAREKNRLKNARCRAKRRLDPERMALLNKKKMEHWHRSEATRLRQAKYIVKRFKDDPEYRDARRKARRGWRLLNLEKDREHKRRSRTKHAKRHKSSIRHARMMKRYGITAEDFSAMLGAQMCLCAGCHKPLTMMHFKPNSCCVDHCHTTGKVRGLLCRKCNVALGLVDDDPSRLCALAEYLQTA